MSVVQGLRELPPSCSDLKLALLLGERALYVNGDLQTARRWYDTAYRQAESCGDPPALARAALGLSGIWVQEQRTSAESEMVRARQRHALSLIDPCSSIALRLRTRMRGEQDYRGGEHAGTLRLLAQARGSGDGLALAEALSLAHHCLLGPEHGALRLELAGELIGHAAITERRGDLLMGLLWRTVDLYLAADPHAERCLAELRRLLDEHAHLAIGYVVSAIDVMLTIRSGRFDEAEAQAGACFERGVAAGDLDATGWYGGHLGAILWYKGRAGELVPALTDLVSSPTLSPIDNSYLAGLALATAVAGDRRQAAGQLARLRGRDLGELPSSSTWLFSLYCAVETAHLLQDADTAVQAYALLSPYARLPVIGSLGVVCFGSVCHSLGMAALTMGDLDLAVEHLRTAVHDNLALGHWPAATLSRCRLGQALALRDGTHDQDALREQSLAAHEARELGMVLPDGPGATAEVPAGRAAAAQGPCRIRRHGRHWQVELGGRVVLVEHSVGMAHLATLVANPGREILAADLAADLAAGTKGPREGESAQPVLDDLARDTYRQRLNHLQAEIDELESMNDLERAAALRLEREWLVAELAAATGIGGRARPFTGSEERARIAVGKAIRRALTRVSAVDQTIGEELRATVQMGVRCCYRPRLAR
ncbi:hypothetical protein SAMN05444920_102881 [Nonomuraea solani]|uniref:MalT-like TPR region domain-containing protein n=1 Tax=Nonomuraea solani TaxID=1144553 RepID=A0A1H5ZV51_9ACTN|nr:hypothetical protein [Nonomuraea solani]SEG40032.1 hypothetical protein SAMN05444920_102881 [Nonomuraea solani]